MLVNQGREGRVGLQQPAARGDAISNIDKLARIHFIKFGEHIGAQKFGVQFGHPVDLLRADNGQMRHAGALLMIVNQRKRAQFRRIAGPGFLNLLEKLGVDAVDNLQMQRQHMAQHRHRPALQRLGQQGVIGKGECAGGDRPRLVPAITVIVHQQMHQFGNGQGGMGIVKLDNGFFRQRVEILMVAQEAGDDVLQGGTDEEIFLFQAQFLPRKGGIIRVEDFRQGFGFGLVLDRLDIIALIEFLQVKIPGGARRPQAQIGHIVIAITGNRHVIGHGDHRLGVEPFTAAMAVLVFNALAAAVKFDLVNHIGALELPRIAVAQPVVGMLDLLAVPDGLREQAKIITHPVAETRITMGDHGFQITRRQTAQTAIAKRRVMLDLDQGVQILPQTGQRIAHLALYPQIKQVLVQLPPEQIFHRKIIDPARFIGVLGAGGVDITLAQNPPEQEGEGVIPVLMGGKGRVLADRMHHIGDQQLF